MNSREHHEQDRNGSAPRPSFPSRRELIAAAGGVLGIAAFPNVANAAVKLCDVAPESEGFFFVVAGATAEADRIFYLKSAWLPFFEITDLYYDADQTDPHAAKKSLAANFKSRAATSAAKWHVMYTDELSPDEIQYNPQRVNVVDVLDVALNNQTYLACNISPSLSAASVSTKPLLSASRDECAE